MPDQYEWAGQIRTVDIRKNVEGAEFFLPSGVELMQVSEPPGVLAPVGLPFRRPAA